MIVLDVQNNSFASIMQNCDPRGPMSHHMAPKLVLKFAWYWRSNGARA